MNVNREKKEKQIQEIREAFENNESFYLLNFDKMPVSKATAFRNNLRDSSYTVKVIKNRLALRALKEEFPEELKEQFAGPTALAFGKTDPIGLARIIKDFSVQNKVLKVKGGIVEGHFLPGEQFDEIAKLSSKKDLIAKLGYLMSYPLMQLYRTWQAPISGFGRLLSQLKDKK